jgi:serine/threonine protein kinase
METKLEYKPLITVNDNAYLVMNRAPGESLLKFMHLQRDNLTAENRFWLSQTLLEELSYISSLGLVHSDLKPANIVVQQDPTLPNSFTVRIIDFGIAQFYPQKEQQGSQEFRGTFTYAAPEQLVSHISPKTDVYSAAIILAIIFGAQLKCQATGHSAAFGQARTYSQKMNYQRSLDIADLPSVIVDKIESLLTSMSIPEPEARADLAISIRQLIKIRDEFISSGSSPHSPQASESIVNETKPQSCWLLPRGTKGFDSVALGEEAIDPFAMDTKASPLPTSTKMEEGSPTVIAQRDTDYQAQVSLSSLLGIFRSPSLPILPTQEDVGAQIRDVSKCST